ncbi:hypothetical protein FA13DRAFT_1781207 [Coprinellus micaceus]|uniref:Uncharacterized protein n=1 Tax=Coprinellus micaceus TaxID=71717 RepID=A0A4Y7SB44_COPMI|nr:hypothetical protein FA13DRAFT_1781207 [Coprinellus micaceus]
MAKDAPSRRSEGTEEGGRFAVQNPPPLCGAGDEPWPQREAPGDPEDNAFLALPARGYRDFRLREAAGDVPEHTSTSLQMPLGERCPFPAAIDYLPPPWVLLFFFASPGHATSPRPTDSPPLRLHSHPAPLPTHPHGSAFDQIWYNVYTPEKSESTEIRNSVLGGTQVPTLQGLWVLRLTDTQGVKVSTGQDARVSALRLQTAERQ